MVCVFSEETPGRDCGPEGARDCTARRPRPCRAMSGGHAMAQWQALPGRLELPTLRLTASRSSQLSYRSSCGVVGRTRVARASEGGSSSGAWPCLPACSLVRRGLWSKWAAAVGMGSLEDPPGFLLTMQPVTVLAQDHCYSDSLGSVSAKKLRTCTAMMIEGVASA